MPGLRLPLCGLSSVSQGGERGFCLLVPVMLLSWSQAADTFPTARRPPGRSATSLAVVRLWLLAGLRYLAALKIHVSHLGDAQIQGDKLLPPVGADSVLGLVSLGRKEQQEMEKGMTRQQRNNVGIGCWVWNSM